jgi:hypothetical protein
MVCDDNDRFFYLETDACSSVVAATILNLCLLFSTKEGNDSVESSS